VFSGNFVFDLCDFDLCSVFQEYIPGIIPDVQLKSGPYFNISNLFTKIYNMLYYTTNVLFTFTVSFGNEIAV
jgi:hypothetical protein